MRFDDNFTVALTRCFYCMESNAIVMNTLLDPATAEKVKQMDGAVVDTRPCAKCEAIMKAGIILISIKDGEKPPPPGEIPNPYRTGSWCAVSEDAMDALFGSADDNGKRMAALARKKRVMFIEDSAWDAMGLPRSIKDIPEGTPTTFEEFQKRQEAEGQ